QGPLKETKSNEFRHRRATLRVVVIGYDHVAGFRCQRLRSIHPREILFGEDLLRRANGVQARLEQSETIHQRGHEVDVMRDEYHREVQVAMQMADQVQDAVL